MKTKQRLFALLLILTAWLGAVAEAAPIKVLLVEGVSNHDWKHRLEIVRAILARDGSFTVDVTITPSVASDPAWATWRPNFAAYDVVVSGYTDINGTLRWPAAVEAAFVQYVNGGGGFYSYHEAMSAFPGWTEYNNMLGLGWRAANYGTAVSINPDESFKYYAPGSGGATAHGNRVDVQVKKLGSHPITAGLPSSWMTSQIEIYRYARGPAQNMTVLSYALDPGTNLQFPIDWVTQYGQGRCYATSYGHVWPDETQPVGTCDAAFQTLFVRALKWLAKRDPGTAVPADFPSPTAISLRAYEEGVSGLDTLQPAGVFANGKLPTQSAPPSSVLVQQAFPSLSWESPIQAMPWPLSTTDLAIAEMDGRIYRVADNDATTARTLVLDIQDRVVYQNWTSNNNTTKTGGIFSMVFHPQFGKGVGKDYLYVYYINNSTDSASAGPPYFDRLSRFTWNPATSTFNPASELILTNQYDKVKGHDGGGMAFGADGFLYICFGDEGSQDADSTPDTQKINDRIRSGVWRIDVDQRGGTISHAIRRQPVNAVAGNGSYTQGYYIPNDNPWQDPSGGTLEEFYALGLRNPLRMTFDAPTGVFWIGDVGGEQREEVDILDAPALNYGWNYAEGNAPGFRAMPSPLIGTNRGPVYDYPHTVGNCVVGGHVYRGNLHPWLRGQYLFGDNGTQRIYALDYNATTHAANSVTEIAQGRSGVLWTGISSFGIDSQGEVLVLQMGGGVAGAGRISRLKPKSTAPDDSRFPATLSATGLFTNLATLTPEPGLIPYEVNMPLWSAGMNKQRWVMVPNDGVADTAAEQITYSQNDPWLLPFGSVFVKQFSHPETGKRIETRVLIHGNDGGWGGITYKWRADGSDADALEAGATEAMTIGGQTFDYLYPARSQCGLCHTPLAGSILGFKTRQLNRQFTYPATGRTANQVETLSKLGLIPTFVSAVDLQSVITSASRDDATVSDQNFVRSYLDANCSHCHQPGGTLANFDARLSTALGNQNLLCGPVNDGLGIAVPVVVKPGRIVDSVAFHRMNTISAGISMPPVAKGRVDDLAVSRLANWIMGMQTDCCTVPPVLSSNSIAVGNGTVPGTTPLSDTYLSNMVINLTDTYTNASGAPLLITFDRFKFHAARVTDPVTPFVVRINSGTFNYTVRAVGTSRSAYVLGANDFPFSTLTQSLTLDVGETIATGFLDALADGTGGGAGAGPITYTDGGDHIHYSGGTGETNSGKVTVGVAPVFGTKVITTLTRNYYYSISFALGSTSPRDDDHDGLPDSWELAYAPRLGMLSATGDYDGDGISDANELLAGTDPFDSKSCFQIRSLRPDPSVPGVVATFDTVPGHSYSILVSSDLKTWETMGTVKAADWPAVTTAIQMSNADLPPGAAQQLFIKATTLPTTP